MTGGNLALVIILTAFALILIGAVIADYHNGRYEWIRAVREGLAHARHDIDHFAEDRKPAQWDSYWLRGRTEGAIYYRVYEKEHTRLVTKLLDSMSPQEVQGLQDGINEIRESRQSKDPALRRQVIGLEKRVVVLETEVEDLKQREVV